MNNLAIEEILFIHYRILVEFQPHFTEITNPSLDKLENLLTQIEESSEDTFSKAALLTKSIITENHFHEGNELLGVVVGIVFLLNYGLEICDNLEDISDTVQSISRSSWKEEQIESWFKEHFLVG